MCFPVHRALRRTTKTSFSVKWVSTGKHTLYFFISPLRRHRSLQGLPEGLPGPGEGEPSAHADVGKPGGQAPTRPAGNRC